MGVVSLSAGRDADHLQYFIHSGSKLCAAYVPAVEMQHFADLVPHGNCRVQARHWVLENHGYRAAPQQAHISIRCREHIRTIQNDTPLCHLSNFFRKQAHNAERSRGLSCPGLSDKAERFA